MVYFQTKNPNLGKFFRAFEWKMLVYFMVIWSILWPFGNVVVIWHTFRRFGILCQEKSGSPDNHTMDDFVFEANSRFR
jgi:peroxiredoxin family protein